MKKPILTVQEILQKAPMQGGDRFYCNKPLHLTEGGEVVSETDPDGRYVLVGEGGSIPADLASYLGLSKSDQAPEPDRSPEANLHKTQEQIDREHRNELPLRPETPTAPDVTADVTQDKATKGESRAEAPDATQVTAEGNVTAKTANVTVKDADKAEEPATTETPNVKDVDAKAVKPGENKAVGNAATK